MSLFLDENDGLTQGELLRRDLLYKRVNGYDRLQPEEPDAMDTYCDGYKSFLDSSKTERECVARTVRLAEAAGFVPFERGMNLEPGSRVYRINRGKAVILAVAGSAGLEKGVNIAAAHIDNPRLDLKPLPLYESDELAFLKTHYYGGLRKYQWVAIPLEIHGVVALKNGQTVRVSVGNGEDDPLFTVDDLLPHLGKEQSEKPLGEAIPGENLNILAGSWPLEDDDGKDRVKLRILEILNMKYGIAEEDFISAELSAVPAFQARDVGFDRSLIGAYGHDDRVCAYAALTALLQLKTPERTAVCMLADKEEIGSEGVSGMQSRFFDTFMEDLCAAQGVLPRVCYENSFCLSTDVTAAYDPNFADVYEKNNSAFVNHGMALSKYTGSRGKAGASDASAELVASVRRILDEAGVVWQMSELGKVDSGGGGTVALFLANRNIDTLDAGVPVLSMHAPWETVGKLDCYMTFKGIKALFENRN